MCKFYKHQIIAQLHQNYNGCWKSIHYHYKIITNHNVELRHLRDAHHYWRSRNRIIRPKTRDRYNQSLIMRLVESHGLNWTLIHKDYCSITNKIIPKVNFVVACRYHLRKFNRLIDIEVNEINNINEFNNFSNGEINHSLNIDNDISNIEINELPNININQINDDDWDF